jgi:hypothetical protein
VINTDEPVLKFSKNCTRDTFQKEIFLLNDDAFLNIPLILILLFIKVLIKYQIFTQYY